MSATDTGGERSQGTNLGEEKQTQVPDGAEVRSSPPGGLSLPTVARQVFLGILLLLSFIAALQFYFTAQDLIRMWVSYTYLPMVNAVFYLAVITGSILIIHRWLISR